MKSCKTCKFNQTRTLENKVCLKGHKALFGFGCYDHKPNIEIVPSEVKQYEIGYQLTIYDFLEDEN